LKVFKTKTASFGMRFLLVGKNRDYARFFVAFFFFFAAMIFRKNYFFKFATKNVLENIFCCLRPELIIGQKKNKYKLFFTKNVDNYFCKKFFGARIFLRRKIILKFCGDQTLRRDSAGGNEPPTNVKVCECFPPAVPRNNIKSITQNPPKRVLRDIRCLRSYIIAEAILQKHSQRKYIAICPKSKSNFGYIF